MNGRKYFNCVIFISTSSRKRFLYKSVLEMNVGFVILCMDIYIYRNNSRRTIARDSHLINRFSWKCYICVMCVCVCAPDVRLGYSIRKPELVASPVVVVVVDVLVYVCACV